ncbi:MAG: hypothetical protein WAX89_02685 [Alphaproteobacteria bacterium]
MRITRLALTTFRNMVEWNVRVPDEAQIVALIGQNGAGKTSVLEALSLLSPGRGLHKAGYDEMVQSAPLSGHPKAHGWGIFAEVTDGAGNPHTIGQQFQGKERAMRIDGTDAPKQASLGEVGSVLWLTPRQDRLFLDGPAPRRDFLDRLVYGLNPSHAETVATYRHHARARLQLLQNHVADDWLELEEERAAQAGVQVLENRRAYVDALTPYLTDTTLELTGATLGIFEEENPVAALQGKFARSRERDRETGSTNTGPQKVDVTGVLTVEGRAIPFPNTSSGQHKRALVGVLLAHVKLAVASTGTAPLVLIDEVAAHLDTARRAHVLNALTHLGAQVWVTETEVERLGGISAHIVPMA